MNNTTFVMGIMLTMLILFLSAGAKAAHAADMADVTLQVLESNDPAEIMNEIELPDLGERADGRDDSRHDMEDDARDSHDEFEDEIEDEIEDAEDDIDDSIDEAEEETD